ncbi:hypothetical protein LTR53_019314, partial [Teratosphaeriaceae sp. CCFEE 6253]
IHPERAGRQLIVGVQQVSRTFYRIRVGVKIVDGYVCESVIKSCVARCPSFDLATPTRAFTPRVLDQ